MLKWTLVAALSFTGVAVASQLHTGELLFKPKGAKSAWGIQKIRPSAKTNLSRLKAEMIASGNYEFVSFNTIDALPTFKRTDGVGDDLDVSNQWHHAKIQTLKSWNLTNLQTHTLVAVCDSGIMHDHEDLAGQLRDGYNMVDGVSDNSTTTSHGTFVGGLIAALANDLAGLGTAPNVSILPIRISDAKGTADMEHIIACIRYAADQGARVINVSFTGVNNPAIEEAGHYASDRGALLVYAAGNAGKYRSRLNYPDYDHVFVVGASTESDKRWKWYKSKKSWGGSNYGPFIDIMAPGADLFSTTLYDPALPLEKYRTGSGTSFAAPVVSAVASLLFSARPDLSPLKVMSYLKRSADRMGSSTYYGAGRVNAYKALKLVASEEEFVSSR